MISRIATTVVFVLGVLVSGCGSVVAPADGGGDGSTMDVVLRPDTCLLPNGGTCAVGASCPAGDGCNTCSCMRGQMFAGCTLIACRDAGPAGCRSADDCTDGRECVFSTSSCDSTGTCELPTPCAEQRVYCSCSGETYRSCRPTQPTRAMGPCSVVRACNSRMACPPTDECVYPVGACAVDGVCRGVTDCAATAEFCSCDGATYRACPNAPTRPTRAAGACPMVPDGGVADAGAPRCAGAMLDAMRRQCTNASGATLAPECCTGWNCDASSVLCDRVPPTCPAGWVGSVAGSCWGPCVPAANCGS
jgi:hypothetical protein